MSTTSAKRTHAQMAEMEPQTTPENDFTPDSDSLHLLIQMAEHMERGSTAVHKSHKTQMAEHVNRGSTAARKTHKPVAATGPSPAVHPPQSVAEVVQKGAVSRLDSWQEIEMLLLDETYSFSIRPTICTEDWCVYRESPKIPRRGRQGKRDLWTNSGGLRGATVWPSEESGLHPRVRRQYGKIRRVDQGKPQHELKFLEYSLVERPDHPLPPRLAKRRLFQSLPVGCLAAKPIKPLRAAVEKWKVITRELRASSGGASTRHRYCS